MKNPMISGIYSYFGIPHARYAHAHKEPYYCSTFEEAGFQLPSISFADQPVVSRLKMGKDGPGLGMDDKDGRGFTGQGGYPVQLGPGRRQVVNMLQGAGGEDRSEVSRRDGR